MCFAKERGGGKKRKRQNLTYVVLVLFVRDKVSVSSSFE